VKHYLDVIVLFGVSLTVWGQTVAGGNPPFSVLSRIPAVSDRQASQGIKEALLKGVQNAIRELGHNGGFLTNLNVKIPLPRQLEPVERTLPRA
jgi:hypothetical protein